MKNYYKHLMFLLLFLSGFFIDLSGQEWYIRYNDEKDTLTVKKNSWFLMVPDSTFIRKADDLNILGISKEQTYTTYDKVVFRVEESTKLTSIQDKLSGFVYVSPLFELEGDNYKHSTGELLLRWNKELSDEDIKEINQKYNLRRIESERVRWLGDFELYELMPPYEYHSIEIANLLYEKAFVDFIEPNFSFIIKRLSFDGGTPNDPRYGQQWNLSKIEMLSAWNFTTGGQSVLAIFDDGVDLTHEDLIDNLLLDGSSNVVGYNATDRGDSDDPHPDGVDFHGTACAGIAAATTHNNLGIAGIAANSKIMPLQMAYTHPVEGPPFLMTTSAWQVACMNFAVDNGADVVSMSLSLGESGVFNNALSNAINNGVVLVAASGNGGASSILYPASNANVIAIGATLQNDSRWANSNYGSNLDMVAPGGQNIWTTTRPGYAQFGGTSAAAPHVAGVIALLRSLNYTLTPSQIRTILRNSADKVPGMGGANFHNQYGYGRLNAYKALKDIYTISGPSIVCTSNSTFTLNSLPPNTEVIWSVNPGNRVTPSSGNGPSATFRGASCTNIGDVTLKFTITQPGSGNIRKTVVVNGPDYNNVKFDVYYSSGLPAPKTTSGTFLLCPHTNYHIYFMNSSICSTSNYSWTLPSGWTFNYQNQNMVSVNTNASPGGNIQVKGQTCCTACGTNVPLLSGYFGQYWSCGFGSLTVYPNPAKSFFEIDIDREMVDNEILSREGEFILTMTDQMGSVKLSDRFREFPHRINTGNMPNGVYIVNITREGNTYSTRILIE